MDRWTSKSARKLAGNLPKKYFNVNVLKTIFYESLQDSENIAENSV